MAVSEKNIAFFAMGIPLLAMLRILGDLKVWVGESGWKECRILLPCIRKGVEFHTLGSTALNNV